jgi:hypothetical protein
VITSRKIGNWKIENGNRKRRGSARGVFVLVTRFMIELAN